MILLQLFNSLFQRQMMQQNRELMKKCYLNGGMFLLITNLMIFYLKFLLIIVYLSIKQHVWHQSLNNCSFLTKYILINLAIFLLQQLIKIRCYTYSLMAGSGIVHRHITKYLDIASNRCIIIIKPIRNRHKSMIVRKCIDAIYDEIFNKVKMKIQRIYGCGIRLDDYQCYNINQSVQMGRKFIPVSTRDRLYKLFQVDLKTVACFKRPKVPTIPRFHCSSDDDEQTQTSPFVKRMEEQEESVATQSC